MVRGEVGSGVIAVPLFDVEQHFGEEPPKEWKRPTFKDCAEADIKLTFFNEDEHAEWHNVDGVDALIVLDDVDVREHAAHWEAGAKQNFDTGLYDAYRILYIHASDYGEMPQVGNLVTIDEGTKDEQLFDLVSCEDEGGVYRMVLERVRQG